MKGSNDSTNEDVSRSGKFSPMDWKLTHWVTFPNTFSAVSQFLETCSDKESYGITIQAGQDAALMSCFALCIDDIVRLSIAVSTLQTMERKCDC
jgi:hypothetical protein